MIGRDDPLPLVLAAIESTPKGGRHGPDKVFVSAIWDRVGRKIGMDLPAFKRWLVEQNRARAVTLARADVVGAMDPELVRRSLIEDRGARFHFAIDRKAPLW